MDRVENAVVELEKGSDRPGQGLTDEKWAQLRRHIERAVEKVCPFWLIDRKDDLIQVGLMRVMAVLKKSEWERELGSSYLMRVAYSALVDEIRRWRRRQEVPLEEEEAGEPQPEAPSPNPERLSMGREAGRGIRDCLSRQVQSRRLALGLNLQGYSVPEAARRLDWTVKKTENLVYRGLADLRDCLKKKGIQP